MTQIEMAPCNECAKRTRHHIRAEYRASGSEGEVSWENTYSVMECGGCGTFSFRDRLWFSEGQDLSGDPNYQDTFYPSRLVKPEPTWFAELPEGLQTVLGETYDAFYNDQRYLAAVGVRTALDMAIVEQIGDAGSFRDKLDLLHMKGQVDKQERDMLKALLEAGNAAAHRGFQPSRQDLEVMLEILEEVLDGLFMRSARTDELHRSATQIRDRVPPRPPNEN